MCNHTQVFILPLTKVHKHDKKTQNAKTKENHKWTNPREIRKSTKRERERRAVTKRCSMLCCRGGGGGGPKAEAHHWWRRTCRRCRRGPGGDAGPGPLLVQPLRQRVQAPRLSDAAPRGAPQPDDLRTLQYHAVTAHRSQAPHAPQAQHAVAEGPAEAPSHVQKGIELVISPRLLVPFPYRAASPTRFCLVCTFFILFFLATAREKCCVRWWWLDRACLRRARDFEYTYYILAKRGI